MRCWQNWVQCTFCLLCLCSVYSRVMLGFIQTSDSAFVDTTRCAGGPKKRKTVEAAALVQLQLKSRGVVLRPDKVVTSPKAQFALQCTWKH